MGPLVKGAVNRHDYHFRLLEFPPRLDIEVVGRQIGQGIKAPAVYIKTIIEARQAFDPAIGGARAVTLLAARCTPVLEVPSHLSLGCTFEANWIGNDRP